jgi:hypothetical protein
VTNKDYQDGETLRRLYHEEELTQPEIAEKYGVATSTICYQMDRHGIEARENVEVQRERERNKPVPLQQKAGYWRWKDGYGEKKGWKRETVPVHRLVYVAHYGFEALRDKHVHHKNRMRFDNRPENLQAVTPDEHREIHAQDGQRASVVAAVP